jgi:hypothetical protein
MMLLWAAAGVPLGVYNIVEEFNIALRIQPQILTTLSLITWAQCLYYGKVFHILFTDILVMHAYNNDELENFYHEMLRRCRIPSCATRGHANRANLRSPSGKVA